MSQSLLFTVNCPEKAVPPEDQGRDELNSLSCVTGRDESDMRRVWMLDCMICLHYLKHQQTPPLSSFHWYKQNNLSPLKKLQWPFCPKVNSLLSPQIFMDESSVPLKHTLVLRGLNVWCRLTLCFHSNWAWIIIIEWTVDKRGRRHKNTSHPILIERSASAQMSTTMYQSKVTVTS